MGGSIRMAILGATALALASHASRAADYYAGKTINIYVGTGENAGAVSQIPRAMVDVMSDHIPGHPLFVIRFMPGAGGIKAANYIYAIAPQDGTVYGFITRGFILAPLLTDKAHFDPSKFNWIGSPLAQPSVGAVWNASTKVRTIQDAMREQTVMGATSGSGSHRSPSLAEMAVVVVIASCRRRRGDPGQALRRSWIASSAPPSEDGSSN